MLCAGIGIGACAFFIFIPPGQQDDTINKIVGGGAAIVVLLCIGVYVVLFRQQKDASNGLTRSVDMADRVTDNMNSGSIEVSVASSAGIADRVPDERTSSVGIADRVPDERSTESARVMIASERIVNYLYFVSLLSWCIFLFFGLVFVLAICITMMLSSAPDPMIKPNFDQPRVDPVTAIKSMTLYLVFLSSFFFTAIATDRIDAVESLKPISSVPCGGSFANICTRACTGALGSSDPTVEKKK